MGLRIGVLYLLPRVVDCSRFLSLLVVALLLLLFLLLFLLVFVGLVVRFASVRCSVAA